MFLVPFLFLLCIGFVCCTECVAYSIVLVLISLYGVEQRLQTPQGQLHAAGVQAYGLRPSNSQIYGNALDERETRRT